ncbi:MAG: hypothetical protein [Bacteriophage sp.]|nr:MAG: hypothetical protein [Bacteriophage sp.]
MSHVVKTIKIKRGAKMHILANGAGRNLRSTIMNHLNIRIMKEQILKKIGKTLVRINVTDQSAEDAYDELVNSSPRLFGMLSSIYRLNDEEERFAWSAGIA